jgi:predicted lipoprotein with Yx(FWY)xxD motif
MNPTKAIAATLTAIAATTAVAVGATPKPIVKPAHNTTLNKIVVVDAKKGMTLYWLSPETKKHLLCKASCTGLWPPLTVKSLHTNVRAAFGIQGKLTVFKRPDGKFQVALRGEPLYHFSGDSAKGQANGDGLQGFGGTWHAVVSRTTSGY